MKKLDVLIQFKVEIQSFKFKLKIMLCFMVFCTNFTHGQQFLIRDNTLLNPDQPTPLLQSSPYSTSTAFNCSLEVGKSFNSLSYRAIFYGGNLGVSQGTTSFGNAGGKWSFIGSWFKYYPLGTQLSTGAYTGNNYLINYHRWGNYSAHFGLRSAQSYFNQGEVSNNWTDSDLKNAVITWGTEHGAAYTSNRLIFQSTEGVDESGAISMVDHEWATILSNGNIGSGTSSPTAQFQIKPINSVPTQPYAMEIFDLNGISKFRFSKVGKLFLGPSNLTNNVPVTTSLAITGNVEIGDGDIYLPDLKTVNDQQLFINSTGKTYAAAIGNGNVNQVWLLGGNYINSFTTRTFGTTSATDVQFKGGGMNSFFIDGTTAHNQGFVSFNKNVVISGGNDLTGYPNGFGLAQDKDYSLVLGSSYDINDTINYSAQYWKSGFLKCATTGGSEVMALGRGELRLFGGYHQISYPNKTWFDGNVKVGSLYPLYGAVSGVGGSSLGGNGTGEMFYVAYVLGGNYQGSDRRLKENITPLEYGLNTILCLKPFTYKLRDINNGMHHGFIAQDLQELFPNSIVGGNETDSTFLAVNYSEFVPILTKAIQQQQSIIDSLEGKLDRIFSSNKIKDDKNIGNHKEVLNEVSLLFQNHPNPFNGITFIDYFLPPNTTNAFLRVIDNNGKLIKAFPINSTGFGQVELDCNNLAEGQYHYNLIVNTKLLDTKSMIIATGNN